MSGMKSSTIKLVLKQKLDDMLKSILDKKVVDAIKADVIVSGGAIASMLAGELMEASYKKMADYLNVEDSEIHFGPSTTQNIYVLANAMRPMWKDGDEIIVSCQDHEANAGAWRKLADKGIKIVEWHVHSETGLLNLEELEGLFSERTKMVAFPHCSNIIGHINPVKEITSSILDFATLCKSALKAKYSLTYKNT